MNLASQSPNQLGQAESAGRWYFRLGTVVVLLLAVAGFSTLAKNSQYYSKSNPAHYINISSKMTVSQSPVIIDRTPPCYVLRTIPPQAETRISRKAEEGYQAVPSIGVTVLLRFRSPPIFLS